MSWFGLNDIEDWVYRNECYPFEDSDGNLCITVKSKYESFGGEKESRLNEAKYYGIDRLLRFYGKLYITDLSRNSSVVGPITPTELYTAATTPEYFISQRVCARMKVLVKIPKETFDKHTANNATCDINKPAEGYLSALISVENYERDIDYITTSMEDFIPKMAKADKYMTNINIVKEIKSLKQVKNVIRRYFNLNSVTAAAVKEEECEPDKQSQMEIGFGYDYKPAFALIDGDKHTIGYDCFLEASLLSHPTTANYLTQLGSMSSALTNQLSLDFDIFQFLSQHTYPTPVIETKKNSLDGLQKYDARGNLFSFANLAKLITLDLDKKSCKPGQDVSDENFIVWNAETRRNIAETSRQSKDFIGNMSFSSEGVEDLKRTGRTVSYYSKDDDTSDFRGQRAIDKIYDDVIDKIDFNCVLEESLKCALEAAITRLGEAAFDDPDLSEFFNADGVVEVFGACGPDDGCEKELQLKVGLPVFQGIKIPDNFPTTDYVAKTIDAALKQLYNALINAIVSFITGIFELMCKMVSAKDFAEIGSMFGDGFTSWLSKTIGIDVSNLKDGEAWADAVLSAGGTGFMGVIGNFVSKTAGSMDSSGNWVWGGSVTAMYSGTGVSLNLPNPSTGMVEEMFVSPELMYQTMSGVKKATEDLEAVLTSEENKSIHKGSASEDVEDVAFECLSAGNPEMFESIKDVTYLFSALGEIVDGDSLEESEATPITVANACQLGDGTNQDIMARNRLTRKDPLLSDSEIEELLSQEKSRLIEKIKKIHKHLKSFQDGTLFPSFPSLFGSDDSLIPEAPPVISDAMKSAASGMYASSINNLNSIITQYPSIWAEVLLDNKVNGTIVDLNDLYGDSQTSFSVENEGAKIVMGYSSTEITTIPSEEYFKALTGYTMIDGWWLLHGPSIDGIDLGDYTNEMTAGSEEPERAVFVEMLSLMGLKVYDYKDRGGINKEMQDMTEMLRDITSGRLYEFLADILTSLNFVDNLGWSDLDTFREYVVDTLKDEVNNFFDQLNVNMEQWTSYDELCQLQIWDSAGKILDLDGGVINDSDDVKDFNRVVDAYAQVDDLYQRAKAALVVMDIANFFEYWDDKGAPTDGDGDGIYYNYWKEKVGSNYSDSNRKNVLGTQPELIDGSWDSDTEIGKITLEYNITDIMSDDKKQELADEQLIENPDDLSVTAFITFKAELNNLNHWYTKASLQYIKAEEDIDIAAIRDDGWTETLTTLERSGTRLIASSAPNTDFADRSSLLAGIRNAVASGGNDKYDVVSANKIITSIGNYKIANDLMISLGRKKSKSNLLKEKYSFKVDDASYTLSSWLNRNTYGSTATFSNATSVAAGQYEEMIIEAGGIEGSDGTSADYEEKIRSLLNDMRARVLTSQYRNQNSIQDMVDSYLKTDAIKYKDLTKWAEQHVSEVMKIQQLDEMCDALSPNRRTAASMGVKMLAREFILESVLISLQVFDTFSTGFMESEAFRQTIFDNMKTEMKKYSNSFEDTVKNDIFSDIKDAAVKYYEYRSLLGDEVEISSGRNTLLSVIGEEISEIRESIVDSLQLSETRSWNDFVLDELIPALGFVVIQSYNEDEQYYFVEVWHSSYNLDNSNGTFNSSVEIKVIPLFSSQCGGTAEEGSKDGGEETVDDCGDKSVSEIVVSGKYITVREQLFNNEEYKEFINNIFPLRELVTQLSVYQASALSDVALFSGTYEGRNFFDIFAETKLSTLQTLLASIHGAGETTYIDPFLEKLKT
jgi:hypothetical protein